MRISEFFQPITDLFHPEEAKKNKERLNKAQKDVVENLELMVNITSNIDDIRTLYALQRTCKNMYAFSNLFFKHLMSVEYEQSYKIKSRIPGIKWNTTYKNYRLIDPKIHETIRENHKQFVKASIGVFAISTIALGVAGSSLLGVANSAFKDAKIEEYMRINGWDHQTALQHYGTVWGNPNQGFPPVDVFGDPNSTVGTGPIALAIIGTLASVTVAGALTMASGIYYLEEDYKP